MPHVASTEEDAEKRMMKNLYASHRMEVMVISL